MRSVLLSAHQNMILWRHTQTGSPAAIKLDKSDHGNKCRVVKSKTARPILKTFAAATYRASGFEAHKPELLFGPPQLLSRRLSVNPLETAASFLDLKFRDLDLCLALRVDRERILSILAILGNGVISAMGLNLVQQLTSGQPAWLMHSLEDSLGPVIMYVPAAALLGAAAAFGLWHVRTWWTANLTLLREVTGTKGPNSSKTSNTFTSALPSLLTATRFILMIAAMRVSTLQPSGWPLFSIALLISSLAPILVVFNTMSSLPGSGSGLTTSLPGSGSGLTSSSSPPDSTPESISSADNEESHGASSSGRSHAAYPQNQKAASLINVIPMLLPLLAADVAAVLCAASSSSLAITAEGVGVTALAAGAALSAALAVIINQKAYQQRMVTWMAVKGDEVEVHVTVKNESGVLIDTSVGKQPLKLVIGQAHSTLIDLQASSVESGSVGNQLEKTEYEEMAGSMSDGQEGVEESSREGSSSSDVSETLFNSTRREQLDGAGVGPMSWQAAQGNNRFRSSLFASLLDQVIPEMVVGERRSVAFHNPMPEEGGFFSPDLVWWQDIEDVEEKFKGEYPLPGEVFWFPLGPGKDENWAPVRVNAINEEFVELDGNVSIEDEEVIVEVELIRLVTAKRDVVVATEAVMKSGDQTVDHKNGG
ncbi:hypothetical protein CEUSTIGMA_g5735.t1 [Chlamydomonas eustigma]|uniref:Uncharacterized protein n=1 Tax=Chlamydomonas eustigma TaxID=1157962 RepID=A0A250X5F1_9CHLO|nr:hypothetical protein CEUSTIGMA_g5735.t1 [Chlamydomonas eustigma]|eukprot:GAX78293.1 hypothetical protein CEUSTIGMA_g5735.t1 [Chlamydomonas eustigma]